MSWERIYAVAPSLPGLDAASVTTWLVQHIGEGARRLQLNDADLDRVRAGATVSKTVPVPVGQLSQLFAAFLRHDADGRPVAGAETPVTVQLRPRFEPVGTRTATLDDGTTIEVPLRERRGTYVDILLLDEHVDVTALKQALWAQLPETTVTRSDGSSARAGATNLGILLVRDEDVRHPAVVFPRWQQPEVITDPAVLEPPPAA